MGEDLFAGRCIALRIRRKRRGKRPGGHQRDRIGGSADPGEGARVQTPGSLRKSSRHSLPTERICPQSHRVARSRRRVWASDLNNAPGSRNDGEPEAMQPDDRGDQVQAKTHAWCVPYSIRPIETPQDGVAFVFAYAGAGIFDWHDVFTIAAK